MKNNSTRPISYDSTKTLGAFAIIQIAFLAPFIILCFYTYPGAEDYAESIVAERFGFWAHVKDLYLTFDGRYFAAIQYATNPLVYKSFVGYKLLAAAFFILIPTAMFVFVRSALGNARIAFLLTVPLTVATIGTLPGITEFYYMVSSMVYLTPTVLFLLLIPIIRQLFTINRGAKRVFLLFGSVLLILAISGSNEIYTGVMLILFGFLMLNGIRSKTDIGERLLLFVAACCGAFMVVTAPGVEKHFVYDSVPVSLEYAVSSGFRTFMKSIDMIHDWISDPTFWIVSGIYVIVGMQTSRFRLRPNLFEAKPLIVLAVILLIIIMLPFPYYFSLNEVDTPGRIYNVVNILLNLWWLVATLYLVKAVNMRKLSPRVGFRNMGVVVISIFCLTSIVLASNWRQSVTDIMNGTAKRYDQEMRQRLDLLNAGPTSVVLKPIKNHPLCYSGFDFNGGWNESYEVFFGVNRIYLEEENTDVTGH